MADHPGHLGAHESDERSSSTGGLPPDFFEVAGSPGSDEDVQAIAACEEPLPARVAGEPAPTHIVIERRASLPVVLVVLAGNIVFFLAGGLAGWAAARKGAGRTELPAAAVTNPPLSEVVRAIEATASESAVEALTTRIGEMRLELGALGRELARLEGRLNARTELAPPADAPPPAPAPPVVPDLSPLKTRLEDLVKEGRKLEQMPATIASLDRRLDAVERGVHALRTDVAAVPKQLDASLMALKGAMESRPPVPKPTSPADLGRDLGAALFRQAKYAAAREVFLTVGQNYPNDARLWYFAALASGLASGDWTGESIALVRRGIACEQKGSPKSPEIDGQFSALTKEQGKEWLDEWRKGAAR